MSGGPVTANDPVNYTDPNGKDRCGSKGCFSSAAHKARFNAILRDQQANKINFIADFTPIVGDIKGFAEFAENPTGLGFVGAVVGVVPFLGDVGSGLIKQVANASSAVTRSLLKNQLLGEAISKGHAFTKYAAEFGAKTPAQFQKKIENILNNATDRFSSLDGRSLHVDRSTGGVVILNPNAADHGTAFVPPDLDEFLKNTNIREPFEGNN